MFHQPLFNMRIFQGVISCRNRRAVERPPYVQESEDCKCIGALSAICFRRSPDGVLPHHIPQTGWISFCHDLSHCSFKGSSGKPLLSQCTVGQAAMLLKQRNALHDERNARKREDYEKLQNQYSSLSTRYKTMAIRINFMHFILAEKCSVESTFWLFKNTLMDTIPVVTGNGMVVAVHAGYLPGIYLGLGTVNSVTDAIFHSLWLSRFLTDQGGYATSDASRFVQVFRL